MSIKVDIVSFYLTDHLGSTRAVVDDQGTVLETFDYYPFGLLMPKRNTASANTYEKFSGKELDENTNQYYFGARYYDPALGRFFVPDRFADKYPSMTPYQYAANNPMGFIDVNGDSLVDDNGNVVNIDINQDDEGNRSAEFTFAEGISQDIIDKFNSNAGRVINAMLETDTGISQVKELQKSENLIGIKISEKIQTVTEDGQKKLRFGLTDRAPGGGIDRQITIFEGSVKVPLSQDNILPKDKLPISSAIQQMGFIVGDPKTAITGGIGSVGVHESVHATTSLQHYADEVVPNALQIQFLLEFSSNNN